MNLNLNLLKKSRNVSSPTFSDSPTLFLLNSASKIQSPFESHIHKNNLNNSAYAANFQHTKLELANIMQDSSSNHDMELKQLINQFNQIQQDLKPKIILLEKQQDFMQRKVDDISQQIKKASIEDFASLQNYYDQLNDKFDKFVNVDVELKINPMLSDILQTYSKLDKLSNKSNSSAANLNENIKEISDKINLFISSQSDGGLNVESLNKIIPLINFLEMHMVQIKEMMMYLSYNQQQNENGVLKKQIERLNANFMDSIKKLSQYCEENTLRLQREISNFLTAKTLFDTQRKEAEQSLELQLKLLLELQNRVSKLEQDSKTKLDLLNQNVKSTFNTLKSNIMNLQEKTLASANELGNKATTDINNFKNQINEKLQRINESIQKSTEENRAAQQEALKLESSIRNQFEDDSGYLKRLKVIEDKIIWCIDAIQDFNEKRAAIRKKGVNTYIIIKRIESLEKRLEVAEERLQADGYNPPERPKLIAKLEQILPPPQNEKIIYEKPVRQRKLPEIPDKIFPD